MSLQAKPVESGLRYPGKLFMQPIHTVVAVIGPIDSCPVPVAPLSASHILPSFVAFMKRTAASGR